MPPKDKGNATKCTKCKSRTAHPKCGALARVPSKPRNLKVFRANLTEKVTKLLTGAKMGHWPGTGGIAPWIVLGHPLTHPVGIGWPGVTKTSQDDTSMTLALQQPRPLYSAAPKGLDNQGESMFEALKNLVGGKGDLPDENTVAVGLLLEVIRMDDDFDAAEKAAVARIIARRYGGTEEEAAKLVSDAADTSRTTYDDNQLLKSIRSQFSTEQQINLIEMLWEIALADGELHRFENHAILAIANKLGMGQSELDATKATAKARLAA